MSDDFEVVPIGTTQKLADLEAMVATLLRLLEKAEEHKGVVLMSNPPQDAWVYHGLSDKIRHAQREAKKILDDQDNKMKMDEMERLTALQHKLEKERDRAAQLELDNFHLRDERTDLMREIAQLKAKIEYLEKSNTQKE